MSVIVVKSKYNKSFPQFMQNDKVFNKEHYDYFMSNLDLNSAAEYAGQFRYVGEDEELELENRKAINKLRREAATMAYRTKNLTQDQRDAYAFDYAMKHNLQLPKTNGTGKANKFTQQFEQLKNNIGGINSTKLQFNVKNNNNNFWWEFWKKNDTTSNIIFDRLGISGDVKKGLIDLGALDITENQDGYSFTVDKSNSNFLKFCEAFDGNEIHRGNIDITGLDSNGDRVSKQYVTLRNDVGGYSVHKADASSQNAKVQSLNDITKLNSIVKQASSMINFDEIDASDAAKKGVQREGRLLGYLSPAHQKITEMYFKGQIDKTTYKNAVDAIKDNVSNLVETSFRMNEVYYNNDKDGVLREASQDERSMLQEEFRWAKENMKDVKYQLAEIGGRLGMYITLPPKVDKKTGLGSSIFNTLSADDQKSRTIFIPDAVIGKASDLFYSDVKTRASQETDLMDSYQYEFDTSYGKVKGLGNGKFVKYVEQYNSRGELKKLKDGTPDYLIEQLDKNSVQNEIAESMSMQDVVRKIQNYTADINGDINTDLIGPALVKVQDDIRAQCNILYNPQSEEELNAYSTLYINGICKLLGINPNSLKY